MVYTKTYLEDFIENIYTNISIYHRRQLNPEEIAARFGIVVDYVDGTSKCVEHGQFSLNMLNQNLSLAAQWQEFAHELCHLFCHAGNQYTLPPFFLKMQKWQAKSFALHFCIPTFFARRTGLNGQQEISYQHDRPDIWCGTRFCRRTA